MPRLGLFLGLCAVVAAAAAASGATGHDSDIAANLEPLTGFALKTHHALPGGAERQLARSLSDERVPHGRAISLQFSAFGRDYDLDLALQDQLVHEEARVVTSEGSRPARMVAFAGRLPGDGGWVRATVHGTDAVHVVFRDEGELRVVEPVAAHRRSLSEASQRHIAEHGVSHVAYRHADAVDKSSAWAWVELWASAHESDAKEQAPAQQHVRKPLQYDMFEDSPYIANDGPYGLLSGCPSTLYMADYGFAHDIGYARKVSGDPGLDGASSSTVVDVDLVESNTQQIVNIINMLYTDQVNLFIRIAEFNVQTTTGGEDWNQEPSDYDFTGYDKDTLGCPVGSGYGNYLDYFKTWYGTKSMPARYDGWHLLTHCFPSPGTVGLAYVSALASADSAVGWSSWTRSTYETVAHEIGHNIGASHALEADGVTIVDEDGGLMSYDSSAEFWFKNEVTLPSDVCDHVSSVTGKLTAFNAGTCGNGILEPDEECDDTSTGCCSNCQLVGQCSPYGNECCQDDCIFAPTTVLCNGGNDFCASGVCTGGDYCGYYSNTECCSRTSSPCKENYFRNDGGSPTSCSATSTNIAEGVVCSTTQTLGYYGECDASGSCVEADSPAVASLTVTAPDSSTTWVIGYSADVEWDLTAASGDTVSITLSDGTVLASSTGNDGAEAITVPDVTEGTYTLTISDGSVEDTSDSFYIEIAPELTVTTDWGSVTVGADVNFEWTVGGSPQEVNVVLYQGDPASYVAALDTLAGDATVFSWTVDADAGDDYIINVNDGADASDWSPYFSISVGDTLALTDPADMQAGLSYSVSVATTGTAIAAVDVYLASTSSEAQLLAAAAVAADATTQLTVTIPSDTAEGDYTLRVQDAGSTGAEAESASFFVSSAAVALSVTSPAADDVWVMDDTATVAWGGADTYAIELYDGATLVHSFSAGVSGGSASVTVPGADVVSAGSDFTVVLTNTADASDTAASAAFQIEDAIAITDVSAGADDWTHGERYTVTWTTLGTTSASSQVNVYLRSYPEGALVDTLAEGSLDVGYASYTVPDEVAGGEYTVEVESVNYGVLGSGEPFSILGLVALSRPLDGDVMFVGNDDVVSWTNTDGYAGGHSVVVTRDGATVFEASTDDADSVAWAPVSGDAGVNYVCTVTSTLTGVSASTTFALQDVAAVTLTYPAEGSSSAVLTVGEAYDVTWDSAGDVPTVQLTLTTSAGAVLVDAEVGNVGYYAWVVPATLATGGALHSVSVAVYGDDAASSSAQFAAEAAAVEVQAGDVTSPETGASLTQGGEVTIVWEGFTASATVSLALWLSSSKTSFSQLRTIESSVANLNAYTWAVPEDVLAGSNRFVRVTSEDGSVASDSGFFSIVEPQPSVVVTELFEGQTGVHWGRGDVATIEFTAEGGVDAVDIFLYDGDAALAYTIVEGADAAAGSFEWTVPFMAPPSVDSLYNVRVASSADPSVYDVYASAFALVDDTATDNSNSGASTATPSITLLYPTADAELVMGSSVTVEWESVHCGHVDVWLLSAGQAVGSALAANLESSGSFVWSLSTELFEAPVFSVRVACVEYTEVVGETDEFSIVADASSSPQLFITAPTSSAEWVVGSEVTVSWAGAYLSETLTLSAGGVTVAAELPASGDYSFALTEAMADTDDVSTMTVTLESTEVSKTSSSFAVAVAPTVAFTAPAGTPVWAKGSNHYIRWDDFGFPFDVEGHLFQGSADRVSLNGLPCLDWVDAVSGAAHSGCEPDAANPTVDVCAVEVTSQGYVALTQACASISSHHTLVLEGVVAGAAASTGKYYLSIPYERYDLPSPGVDYTLQLVNADTGDVFYSGFFNVSYPPALVTFKAWYGEADMGVEGSAERASWEAALVDALASVLGIDSGRISVSAIVLGTGDLPSSSSSSSSAAGRRLATSDRATISVAIDSTTNPDDDSGTDVGDSFAALVSDTSSAVYSNDLLDQVDADSGVEVVEIDTSEPSEEPEGDDDSDDWETYALGAGLGVGAIVVVAGAAVAVHRCRKSGGGRQPPQERGTFANFNSNALPVQPVPQRNPMQSPTARPPPPQVELGNRGAPLPPGWFEATADSGERYYFNSATGETSWTRP